LHLTIASVTLAGEANVRRTIYKTDAQDKEYQCGNNKLHCEWRELQLPERNFGELKPHNSALYQMVAESGQSALKALLIMNAGATVTFLSFITHIASNKIIISNPGSFVWAISLFITSTFLAVLSYGTIFTTNCYSLRDGQGHDSLNRLVWFRVTCILGYMSAGVFVLGCIKALFALKENTASIFGGG
jgi:hypothetical protein